MIPNERLVSGVLRNDTLEVDHVGLEITVWLAHSADADRAASALEAETGGSVAIAEITAGGVRLVVGAERVPAAEKGPREAELRARCLRRLRAEGLLEA